MFLLKLLGYQGLSMRDLEPYLQGHRRGKVVGITFDDGYQNNVSNALPVLKKHGFTATCYGVSSMIGGCNSWDQHIGVAEKLLMTIEDWRTWRDGGMDIGSHTRTHEDLTKLTEDAAFDQIEGSKRELEGLLGYEVRHFCYPYGCFDATHRDMVQQTGYITATTTRRGRVHADDDTFALRRILVANATNLALFAAKIMTEYDNRRG